MRAHLVLDDALAASGAQVERPIGIQAHERFGTGLGKGGVQRVVSGHAEACPLVPACSGRSDLTDWFTQTLRGTKQDLSAGYKKMANECGLSLQLDYWAPLIADMRANPSRHITADANYLEMKTGYDRLMREDPAWAADMAARAAKLAKGRPSRLRVPLA